MGFLKLTDILEKLKKQYPPLGNRVNEAMALSQWEQVVGPQIAKHSRVLRVENGILKVEVDHPIWKTELHHRKRQIIERLNARDGSGNAPREVIKDIFFF